MSSHRRVIAVSVALCATLAACGASESAGSETITTVSPSTGKTTEPADGGFCEAMAHLIVLLAPTDDSSPGETKATFTEAARWFEQAAAMAPAAIAGDVTAYKTAYDEYIHYLDTVGFNLDRVFSTPQGRQLAIDTSHSLTPAIVQYVVDDCGLSFGDEGHEPPTT